MMQAYTTVKAFASGEFTEKRSRFIGSVKPVSTQEQAAAFISEMKTAHYGAAHNCSAYYLRAGVQRYSDDGEPQGTAGIPILEVLRRDGVVDAAIVVTRYFGGILLGAGGLARAYSHAAKLALCSAEKLVMQQCTVFSIVSPYSLYDRVSLLLQQHGTTVLESNFTAAVELTLRMPSAGLERLTVEIAGLSGGQIIPVVLSEIFA